MGHFIVVQGIFDHFRRFGMLTLIAYLRKTKRVTPTIDTSLVVLTILRFFGQLDLSNLPLTFPYIFLDHFCLIDRCSISSISMALILRGRFETYILMGRSPLFVGLFPDVICALYIHFFGIYKWTINFVQAMINCPIHTPRIIVRIRVSTWFIDVLKSSLMLQPNFRILLNRKCRTWRAF